jgi:hypothetical protein
MSVIVLDRFEAFGGKGEAGARAFRRRSQAKRCGSFAGRKQQQDYRNQGRLINVVFKDRRPGANVIKLVTAESYDFS